MQNSKPAAPALEALGITAGERADVLDFVESWDSHGGPLLFVGGGMSRFEAVPKPGTSEDVKIADWAQLIGGVRFALTGGDRDLDGIVPADHLGAAKAYADERGLRRLVDKIEQAVPSTSFEPGPAHLALRRFSWASILTTNYDDLLERTFDVANRRCFKVVADVDLTRSRTKDSVAIIKMHGCLEAPESIVLTADDYADYPSKRPVVMNKVRGLLYEHPTLFLGCSLTDPNVSAMLDWVRDRSGGYTLPSVALVHSAPSSDNRKHWAERGIRLVYLPAKRTVLDFLNALHLTWRPAAQVGDAHPPPSKLSELEKALDAREDGWLERAAALLAEVVTSSISSSGVSRSSWNAACSKCTGAFERRRSTAYSLSRQPQRGRASSFSRARRRPTCAVAAPSSHRRSCRCSATTGSRNIWIAW